MVAKKVARRPAKRATKATKKPAKRTAKKTPTKRRLSAAEREAIIEAKRQSQQISHYLRSLTGPRTIDPEVLAEKIVQAKELVGSTTGLKRLAAVQRQRDLERMKGGTGQSQYEGEFIKYAKTYGEKNGIDYGSWRAVGVDAAVLKKAGISRTNA